ncbi:YtxH domain-containing protein [Oceanobacillus luteolus]|uniref:YtxH domain-containing protein n=1 Tax=Oceanobacillus luteolus TaxID=1274358 RepID=A0ABW4HL28_9BACI|nr:YtxH domain-containing protein [Oceanobacillus luteolus]MCM3739509.1 YtxH domain-containing protein [Oceanobacillus luteolus]
MGQRKLIFGMVAGALLGALAMQYDKETRSYTKECLNKLKDNSSELLSNPTETVHKLRESFDRVNQNFTVGAENTINALEQVETTLDRLMNKN